jgi:RNA polymerase sigma-70 factor (ECF subfamily)
MLPRSPFEDDGKTDGVRVPGNEAEQEQAELLPSTNPAFGSLDDDGLAARLFSGCQDALTVLFERHSALVFRIARRILRDDGEAEETVQQVFLDVYRSIAQFDPRRGSFKSWLLQYAYHRTINRREHLQARRFYDWRQLDDMLPSELSDGASRPFQLSAQEIARLAEELLASLEPWPRKVLELTFYNGLTAEEIAKGSGETASAVRHTLYRSLGKLRGALLAGASGRKAAELDASVPKEGVCVVSPRTL